MSNTVEIGGVMWDADSIKQPLSTLDPIVYNQYPFVREGMTIEEYLREKEYYKKNYSKVVNGTYLPMWKQVDING